MNRILTREETARVFSDIITEQASKLSAESGISFEEAFVKLANGLTAGLFYGPLFKRE